MGLKSEISTSEVQKRISSSRTCSTISETRFILCTHFSYFKRWLEIVHIVNDIDKLISAEIPDCETNLMLYNTVVKNIIHGSCDSRCIIDGQSSKITQKNFERKLISTYGYLYYK